MIYKFLTGLLMVSIILFITPATINALWIMFLLTILFCYAYFVFSLLMKGLENVAITFQDQKGKISLKGFSKIVIGFILLLSWIYIIILCDIKNINVFELNEFLNYIRK